ncbi:MAG TPA: hypothetical protein VG248_07025 [Caulobacteraceae bacterium]|jgi:hypothetical protein|nr:hypothetical protein [Caulobacteraceae bacterium]
MNRTFRTLAAAAAAAAALGFASGSLAQGHPREGAPCFFISQWRGWKAPNPHTLYLGVSLHEVYEADLSGDEPLLMDSATHLISHVVGSSSICSPLDLQLEIADLGGMKAPLIVRHLRKLTPEEVAAIPPKYRPN